MEYCSGGNLAEMLQRVGRLPLPRALRLMDRVLAGVEFAHQRGIVHRDLKAGNILLAKPGAASTIQSERFRPCQKLCSRGFVGDDYRWHDWWQLAIYASRTAN